MQLEVGQHETFQVTSSSFVCKVIILINFTITLSSDNIRGMRREEKAQIGYLVLN